MNAAEYDRMFGAEERHWWYRTLHALICSHVRAEYRVQGPLRLFDAGCGTGGLMQQLNSFGAVEGCDLAPAALAACRQRGLAGAFAADLNTVTLSPGAYHVITAIDVLYHRWITDEVAVLRRLHDGLRPGGLLLMNEVALESLRSPHDEAVMTRRRFTPQELRTALEAAGFHVERATFRLALTFPAIVLVRALRRRARRAAAAHRPPRSDVWMPPAPLNALLRAIGALDNAWVCRAAQPIGSSVFIVARRPGPR